MTTNNQNSLDDILIEVRHGRMSNTKAKAAINKIIMEDLLESLMDNFRSSAMTTTETNHYGAGYNAALEDVREAITKKYGRADNE